MAGERATHAVLPRDPYGIGLGRGRVRRQTRVMPSGASLATFAAVSAVLVLVPGPSVLFVVGRALALGRRAALVTVAGNAAGFAVLVVAVAVGLGAVVERSVAVFTVVKLAGAAYVVWLGAQAIRAARLPDAGELDATVERSSVAAPPRMRSVFAEGFVVGVANPKVVVFLAAILPQYVEPDGLAPPLQMIALGALFVVVALVGDSLWGLVAGTARAWFARSPRRTRQLGRAGGAAMVGLGVHLAVSGRAD